MSKTVTITIDDKQISVPEGEKVLWAALDNDIYIPHLCANKDSEHIAASCRLCFVEVEGMPNPVTSCTLPVEEGMVIRTRSSKVDKLVATGFELLLSNHRLGCKDCTKNGKCELQKIAKERGLKLKLTRLRSIVEETPIDESPESFNYDPSRCVLCGQCVFVDQKKVKVGALGFIRRGMSRKVSTFGEVDLADSKCIQCGACVKACPVGALAPKPEAK